MKHRVYFVLSVLAASLVMTGGNSEPVGAAGATATFASWSSATGGSLGAAYFTITLTGDDTATSLTNVDMSTANFAPAGSATQPSIAMSATSTLTVGFDSTVTNPAIYFKYLRGPYGPLSYALSSTGGSCTWSIQSGLPNATLVGSTLTPSSSTFNDGIVLCTGSVTGISLVPSGGNCCGSQVIDIATISGGAPSTDYTTDGFFAPIRMDGWNTVKAGSTVPFKFRVSLDGTVVDSLDVVSEAVGGSISCDGPASVGRTSAEPHSASLRFDAVSQQFVANVKTPKIPGMCFRITVTIADGDTLTADFRLTR